MIVLGVALGPGQPPNKRLEEIERGVKQTMRLCDSKHKLQRSTRNGHIIHLFIEFVQYSRHFGCLAQAPTVRERVWVEAPCVRDLLRLCVLLTLSEDGSEWVFNAAFDGAK